MRTPLLGAHSSGNRVRTPLRIGVGGSRPHFGARKGFIGLRLMIGKGRDPMAFATGNAASGSDRFMAALAAVSFRADGRGRTSVDSMAMT
jgi:hypothetical protein